MNRRINKILLDMIHNQRINLQDYADMFSVSKRTILNDLKDINNYFGEKRLILDKDEYLIMNIKTDLKEIINTYASIQNYNLSLEERRTVLALLLISEKEFVTTYFLSEYVLVSRNTLLADIEELKSWFKKNNLNLNSYVGKGYLVEGDEETIRNTALKLLIYNGLFDDYNDYAFSIEGNIFQNLLLDIVDKNIIYESLKKIVITSEEKSEVQLTDYSFKEVVCYLLIMVNRITIEKNIIKNKERQKLVNSSKYSFSSGICELLEEKLGIKISNEEVIYLTSILRSKSYIKNNARKIDSIEIQILVNEFMFSISKEFNIKYYINSDLFDLLENHLKLLIYRVKQRTYIKNALFREIHKNYEWVFPKIKRNLKNIEEYLQKNISEDEISFIVMYIMSIVENNKSVKVKIKIICNSGRGTAQLLKQSILSLFNQVEIISVDSFHAVQTLKNEDQDVVVSTIPIQNKDIPIILVNPILTDIDIINLRQKIQEIQFNKNTQNTVYSLNESKNDIFLNDLSNLAKKYMEDDVLSKFMFEFENIYYSNNDEQAEIVSSNSINYLTELLDLKRIVLDVEIKSWQEGIRYAGEVLYKDKLISQNYIKSMIDLVEANNPYIVIAPGVAIPHAEANDGAFNQGACLIRLKNPVIFNHEANDPVKYIIAFSITDNVNIGPCLYNFTEILSHYDFLKEMDNCKNNNEIIDTLKRMELKMKGNV